MKRGTALLFGWFLLLAACGRMGDPIPPGHSPLESPKSLSAAGREDGLTISWSMPSRTLAGGPGEAAGFSIERAELPEGKEDCAACAGSYSEAGRVPAPGNSWTDITAEPGKSYAYRVSALDERGGSGSPSAPVAAAFYRLDKPLVEVLPSDGGALVRYSFADPTVRYEGVTAYGPDGRLLAVFGEDKSEGSISGLKNGEKVSLAFRSSAATPQGWRVESAPVVLEVTPRDFAPPLPPRELAGFAEGGGVRLMWMVPQGEPFDKVFVYRAGEGGALAKIGSAPGSMSFYVDLSGAPGATYSYGCTGVDGAGNESGMSPIVRVKYPAPKDSPL